MVEASKKDFANLDIFVFAADGFRDSWEGRPNDGRVERCGEADETDEREDHPKAPDPWGGRYWCVDMVGDIRVVMSIAITVPVRRRWKFVVNRHRFLGFRARHRHESRLVVLNKHLHVPSSRRGSQTVRT